MKFIDLTGKTFNRLTVIERVPTPPGKHTKWQCRCECGNTTVVDSSCLKNGITKSCGCYKKEAISKAQIEDLTGKTFGLLTVIELDHIAPNRQCIWKCKCSCGNYTSVYASNLKRNHTRSCGCIGSSEGENIIETALTSLRVNHCREYKFEDLKGPGGGCLSFDFAIMNNEDDLLGLIEYQGIQHYIEMPNDKHFGQLQREITDKLKKEYCTKKEQPLEEIRYDEDLITALRKALQNIYSHVNSVPSTAEEL